MTNARRLRLLADAAGTLSVLAELYVREQAGKTGHEQLKERYERAIKQVLMAVGEIKEGENNGV